MRTVQSLVVALVVVCVSAPAWAYKWQISDDSYIGVGALIQAQAQFTEDAAPSGDTWSKDFFLRRARIMVFGQLNKYVSFFMETDTPNFGKNGNWDTNQFFIQDAYGTFKVVDEFMVDAGMILLPFTRHNLIGATSLNALDYHGDLIKFPTGSTKVWRDAGVQFRGYIFNQKLQYRVGVFSGSQGVKVKDKDPTGKEVETGATNPSDYPRVTGHVRYNIFGTETDFFPKGIYFPKEPILSVGVGVDFVPDSVKTKAATFDAQNHVATKPEFGHHLGVAGDVFLDYPIGDDHEVVFQGTFFFYRDGKKDDKLKTSGIGSLVEAGYRWRFIEPVISFDYFKSDADNSDLLGIRGGLNFWLLKHNASVKAEFGARKEEKPSDANKPSDAKFVKQATLQAQVLF